MSTIDKLTKALEALKLSKDSSTSMEDEAALRRKKKMELCSVVADTMGSANVKNAPNFPSLLCYSIETLLNLCDHSDSDVRMIADESLNRIIRAMMDNNIVKVHVELHKEIKKNGSERSLRVALSKFAQLAHMIRPQKGKAYVQNLVPCLVAIAARREEAVLETLATALPLILTALGPFTSDNNIQDLLTSFILNLSDEETVVRRTAATSIVSVCLQSRKPQYFLTRTLNTIVDKLKREEQRKAQLGILNCIRHLLLHLDASAVDPACEQCLIEVYELCVKFASDEEHNLITTALETLHQLLVNSSAGLVKALTSPTGLGSSRLLVLTRKTGERSATPSSMGRRSPASPVASLETQDQEENIVHGHTRLLTSATASVIDSASEESDAEAGNRADMVDLAPFLGSTMERAASLESEDLLRDETPSPAIVPGDQTDNANKVVWDIGDVTGSEMTLRFCCRFLVTRFLLPETEDQPVRVRISVRALALQCLTQVLRMDPSSFFCTIDLNGQTTKDGFSHVSDVLSNRIHGDPQLRGLYCTLAGTLVKSVLTVYSSFPQFQQLSALEKHKELLPQLLTLLSKGLEDESSTCVRHALSGVQLCLSSLLASCHHKMAANMLPTLLKVASNPYWLVKVKVLEILGDLPYLHIYYATSTVSFQSKVMYSVLLEPSILGNEDPRVRTATSNAIASVVKNFYFGYVQGKKDSDFRLTSHLTNKYLSGLFDRHVEPGVDQSVESTLNKVVHVLSGLILGSSKMQMIAGAVEALCILSEKYPPVSFPRSWHCFDKVTIDWKSVYRGTESGCGLLSYCWALLSERALDLDLHYSLLVLSANLFTGLATVNLKVKDEGDQLWSQFKDQRLGNLAELVLTHLMRLLRIFVRILDDSGSKEPTPSPIKRKAGRAASPGKQSMNAGDKDINKEEKGNYGQFAHCPHLNKLYEKVKSAYSSYKSQLECSDKVGKLLNATLTTLGCVLEFAQQTESGRVAEEMLSYLRITVTLDPTASVVTVQKLLKSLFGCNASATWEEPPAVTEPVASSPTSPSTRAPSWGFSQVLLQQPYAHLGLCTEEPNDLTLLHNRLQRERMNQKKASCAIKAMKASDRQALASYIRLFEPMVIQSLKQYTVTTNVKLQAAVLSLLTQLVQLRVNYCLLDSDQIFIDFVLKQFEYLELGQIKGAEELIPNMFEFLGHLSYEKNHSKPVISVAKVIQLCDGLMASGQDPLTHCIPALLPIVEHVFMTASSTSAWQVKTQRDVVVAMLLRLAEYPQVLKLITMILRVEKGSEECRRWALQTADVLMPLFTHLGRVRLDSPQDLVTLLCLLDSFPTRTFSPPDPILRVLFTSQRQDVERESRSYAAMLAMLIYLVSHTEDSVLARLEDLKFSVREKSEDPLNATAANVNYPPQVELGRLLVRTLYNLSRKLHSSLTSCHDNGSSCYLQYLLCHFIVCCTHILRSSSHQTMASGFVKAAEMEASYFLDTVTWICPSRCPLTAVLWSSLVAAVTPDTSFWPRFIDNRNNNEEVLSLNLVVSKVGHLIAYCNFITERPGCVGDSAWLISQHFDLLLTHYTETAVVGYLEVCRNSPLTSSLLLPAVAKFYASKPSPNMLGRVLDFLVSISLDDSGSVLNVLVPISLQSHLVFARRAAAMASSRVEYLLMLETEEVTRLFHREDFVALLLLLKDNTHASARNSGLTGLFFKLGETHYKNSPPAEQNIDPHHIQALVLDKSWYLSQVRSWCCLPYAGKQGCKMLTNLALDDLSSVFRCQHFNNYLLPQCFLLGAQSSKQERKCKENVEKENHVSELFSATSTALFARIRHIHSLLPRLHRVYSPSGREAFAKEKKFTDRLNELFSDVQFVDTVNQLIPAVSSYMTNVSELTDGQAQQMIHGQAGQDLANFAVLCIELMHWRFNTKGMIGKMNGMECAIKLFRLKTVSHQLSVTQLGSIAAMMSTMIFLITDSPLDLPNEPEAEMSVEEESVVNWHTGRQMAAIISWLQVSWSGEVEPDLKYETPRVKNIKQLVQSIARCDQLKSYCMVPVDYWPPTDPDNLSPPRLPPVLDQDSFFEVSYRIITLGWTSRTEFEELWMCLLTALNLESVSDESQSQVLNSWTIKVITSLLLATLRQSAPGDVNSEYLHSSRDKPLKYKPKLEAVLEALNWQMKSWENFCLQESVNAIRVNKPYNLEYPGRYLFGPVSIRFLKTAVMSAEERSNAPVNPDYEAFSKRLAESGVDLSSCIQLLLDLFSQWIPTIQQAKSQEGMRLLLEIMQVCLALSDLFTERSHFAWLLDWSMDLFTSHGMEDELLFTSIVMCSSKSAAVLPALETGTCETLLKMLDMALKNQHTFMQHSGIQGLLYLLETFIHQKDDTSEVSENTPSKSINMRQRLLQIASEYIDSLVTNGIPSYYSQWLELMSYSLMFYILENAPGELSPDVLTFLLKQTIFSYKELHILIYQGLMQALARLVLAEVEGVQAPVMRLAIAALGESDPAVSITGLQVMLICLYSGEYSKMKVEGGMEDPEQLAATREKITCLFDRVRKSAPFEAGCICAVLPFVMEDFFPASEVLTKVFAEFLAPSQANQQRVSDVVFEVVSQACREEQLALLQAWIVMSLNAFPQTLSPNTAAWCLSCFFISASTNPWLRSMFPQVKTRMCKCTYDDRKLLCIAALDFYNQLDDELKASFFKSFSEAANSKEKSAFADVLVCLKEVRKKSGTQ